MESKVVLIIALLAPWALATGVDAAPGCIARPFGEVPALRVVPAEPAAEPEGPALAAPSTGNLHLLVLLAEFSDIAHRVDPALLADRLFGPGLSVREYFREVSDGRLDVTGDVFGWFPLPRTEFGYSQGVAGVGPYPNNGQRMTEHAVQAAVAGGVDLGDYDADGDGVVDALLVIHSGQGYEWAGSTGLQGASSSPDPNAINSHKWTVVEGDFGVGTRVRDYVTGPELQLAKPAAAPGWTDSVATIGVYCHELGHILGLPDFYDTGTFENEVGLWDIMDFGTWNRVGSDPSRSAPGAVPAHPSAWSKLAMGWADAATVAPAVGNVAQQTVILESASGGGFPLQLLGNPDGVDWRPGAPGTGEYFLAEVRTRTGFDAGLPSEGLLLYHVDESRLNNNAASNADGGALLRLLPEDGKTSASVGGNPDTTDHWPGQQTAFGPSSDPDSDRYDGSPSGVSISAIGPLSVGTVTLEVTVENLATGVALPFARPNPYSPRQHGTVGFVLSVGAGVTELSATVHDVTGRRVRTLAAGDFDAAGRVVSWDGRRDDGRPAPAGIYWLRHAASSGTAPRVVLLR